jgi:putative ABC transport system permease protein
MSVAWKLAWSYALRHPARMLLTSLAMVASACIVVWVVSGYDALASQFGQQAAGYLGRYDFFIVPEDPKNASLDAGLVASLRQDPAVAEATAVAQVQIQRFMNPNAEPGEMGGGLQGGGRSRAGGAAANGSPRPMREGPGAKAEQPPGSPSQRAARPDSLSKTAGPGTRQRPGGPGGFPGLGGAPTLVGTDAEAPPYPMIEGAWVDPQHPERRGAVIGKNTAEQMKLKLGDEALLILGTKEYHLRIVGVIEEGPSQMGMVRRMRSPGSDAPRTGIEAGPAASAVYVPMALAEHFTRNKAKINLINIQLKPEAKLQTPQFRGAWEKRIAQARPSASILGVDDIKSNIEEGMMASRSKQEAWAATGLSLLAALFIIFTTLSMGVTERVRQFAVMRAVGLTRGQVAQVIAIEALILALIGWAGGLLAGWGLLAVVAKVQADQPAGLFRGGASLGTWCILLTGLSAFGGALAASIPPAWRAMSVQPLEAMSPRRSTQPNMFWTTLLGVAGLVLILVNPILVYVASGSMSSDKLYYIYMAVGCTTMAVGFLLLTPAMILIVEAVFGPLVARLLGLEPRLLRSQLGSNLWRTLGTTAALTVGLGLFVAMQIWGYSMLEPFKPGDWIPDMLVAFQRGGLPDAEIDAVRNIEGVRANQCIPLAVEQPRLAADITGSEEHNSVIRQNNVIMIGLDPQTGFGGSDPLLKVHFVEGNAAEAVAKLKQGRNCIVPDHFLKAANLKLGDRFAMIPPDSPTKRVEYTIVGAVSLPGWHWMTKFSGLRRREGRSAAMVFADYDAVRRDFDLKQINFFWMNVDKAFGERHLADVVKAEAVRKAAAGRDAAVSQGPMATDLVIDAKRAAVVKIGEALRPIADRNTGEKQPVNGQGTWAAGATMFGESVRISTPDEIFTRITARASGMIWASCYLPLITLVVTSLGVINTIMASVRARRWEFGILRSQGVTRSGLFRMILAEGILIGLITCLLSLGFGILSGWCGTGISQYVSFFGGLAPPLVVPWAQLSIGFGMAFGLCLLAALWPAILTGRAEPLKLLQAGRAAM